MKSTNYHDTFITVAPDCAADRGTAPTEGTVAHVAYTMVHAHPYRYTSDDVIFGVHATRRKLAEAELASAREAFFAKPQACLRASDLGKRYGWSVHSDAAGRVALVGVESPQYAAFAAGRGVSKVTPAMRSKRA
jgi:hypothetical protein